MLTASAARSAAWVIASKMETWREADLRQRGYHGPIDWPEVAKQLEGQGWIVFPVGLEGEETGLAVYPGRWRGRPYGSWPEQGVALAEDRVCAWMRQLARPYPEALGDAAAHVLRTTSRERALAPLAEYLAGYERGKGRAARARVEATLWRAFRRRLQEMVDK